MSNKKFIGNPSVPGQVPGNPMSIDQLLNVSRATTFTGGQGLSYQDLDQAGIDLNKKASQRAFKETLISDDIAGVGNSFREIRARQQSWGDIAAKGLGNFAGKTLVNVAGGLGTTATIIGSAIAGVGKGVANVFGADYEVGVKKLMDRMVNGDVVKWSDAASKSVQDTFEIYRTRRFNDRSLASQLGTAEYWFGTVGDGMSFVTGALLTHYITAGLGSLVSTGAKAAAGAFVAGQGVAKSMSATRSLTQTMANWGGKVNKLTQFRKMKGAIPGVDKIKQGAIAASMKGSALDDAAGAMYSSNGIIAANAAKAGSSLIKGIVTGSSYEASIQAHAFYNEALEAAVAKQEDELGRNLTEEERAAIVKDVSNAANGVFGANLALVTASNVIAFGSTFFPVATRLAKKGFNLDGVMKGTRLVYNKGNYTSYIKNLKNKMAAAKAAGETGKFKMLKAKLFAKKAQAYSYVVSKDFVSEGIIEELGQSSIHEGAMNFILSKYDPYSAHTGGGLISSMIDQYRQDVGNLRNFDKKQWEDVLAGGILGLVGSPSLGGKYGITWQGSVVQDIRDYHKELSDVEELGEQTLGATQSILQDLMPYYTANQSYFENEMQAESEGDGHQLRNAQSAKLSALVAMHYHAGTHTTLSKEIDVYFENLSEEDVNNMFNPDGDKTEQEVKQAMKEKKAKMQSQINNRIKAMRMAEGWNVSLQERDIIDAVAFNLAQIDDKTERMSEIVQALPQLLSKVKLSGENAKFINELLAAEDPLDLLKEALLTRAVSVKSQTEKVDTGLDFESLTQKEKELFEDMKAFEKSTQANVALIDKEIAQYEAQPDSAEKTAELATLRKQRKDELENNIRGKGLTEENNKRKKKLEDTIKELNDRYKTNIDPAVVDTYDKLAEAAKGISTTIYQPSSVIKRPYEAVTNNKALEALVAELRTLNEPEAADVVKMLEDMLKMTVTTEKLALETKLLKTKEGAQTFLMERNEMLEALLELALDESNTAGDSEIYDLVSKRMAAMAAMNPGLENDESITIDQLIKEVKSRLGDPLAGFQTVAAKRRIEQAGDKANDDVYKQFQARYNKVMAEYNRGTPDIDEMKKLAADMKAAMADPDIDPVVKTLIQDLYNPLAAAIFNLTGKTPDEQNKDADDEETTSTNNAISSVYELSQVRFSQEILNLGNYKNMANVIELLDRLNGKFVRASRSLQAVKSKGVSSAKTQSTEAQAEEQFNEAQQTMEKFGLAVTSGDPALMALYTDPESAETKALENAIDTLISLIASEVDTQEEFEESLSETAGYLNTISEGIKANFDTNSNIFDEIKTALEEHGKAKKANKKSNLNLSFAFEEMEYETKELNKEISEVPGLDGSQYVDAAGRAKTKVIAVYGTINGQRMKIGYYFDPRRFRYKGQKINWKEVKANPENYLDLLYHMNSNFVYRSPDGKYRLKTLVNNQALNVNYFLDYINTMVDAFEAMQSEITGGKKTDDELTQEIMKEMGLTLAPVGAEVVSTASNYKEGLAHADEIKDEDSFVKTMLEIVKNAKATIENMNDLGIASSYVVRLGLSSPKLSVLSDREHTLPSIMGQDDTYIADQLRKFWKEYKAQADAAGIDLSETLLTGSVNITEPLAYQDPDRENNANQQFIQNSKAPSSIQTVVPTQDMLDKIIEDKLKEKRAANQDENQAELYSDIIDKYFDLKGAVYNIDLTRPDKNTGEKLPVASRPTIDMIDSDEFFEYKGQKVAIVTATRNSDTKRRKNKYGQSVPVREVDKRFIYVQIDGGEWVQINMEANPDPEYADMLDELLFNSSSVDDFDQSFEEKTKDLNSQQYILITKGDNSYNQGFTVRSLSRPVGTNKAKAKIQKSINATAKAAMSDEAINEDAKRLSKAGKQDSSYLQPVTVNEEGRRVGVLTTTVKAKTEDGLAPVRIQADISIYRNPVNTKQEEKDADTDEEPTISEKDQEKLDDIDMKITLLNVKKGRNIKNNKPNDKIDAEIAELKKKQEAIKKSSKAQTKAKKNKNVRSDFFTTLKEMYRKLKKGEQLSVEEVKKQTGFDIEPVIAVTVKASMKVNGTTGATIKPVRIVLGREDGIYWDAQKGVFVKSNVKYGTTIIASEPVEATYEDIMEAINNKLKETLALDNNPLKTTIATTLNNAAGRTKKGTMKPGYEAAEKALKNFKVSHLTLEYEIDKTDDGQLDLSEMRVNYVPKVGMSLVPKKVDSDWKAKREQDLEKMGGAANIKDSVWKDAKMRTNMTGIFNFLNMLRDIILDPKSGVDSIASITPQKFFELISNDKTAIGKSAVAATIKSVIAAQENITNEDGTLNKDGVKLIQDLVYEIFGNSGKNKITFVDQFRLEIWNVVKGGKTWKKVPAGSLKMLVQYLNSIGIKGDTDQETIDLVSKMLGASTKLANAMTRDQQEEKKKEETKKEKKTTPTKKKPPKNSSGKTIQLLTKDEVDEAILKIKAVDPTTLHSKPYLFVKAKLKQLTEGTKTLQEIEHEAYNHAKGIGGLLEIIGINERLLDSDLYDEDMQTTIEELNKEIRKAQDTLGKHLMTQFNKARNTSGASTKPTSTPKPSTTSKPAANPSGKGPSKTKKLDDPTLTKEEAGEIERTIRQRLKERFTDPAFIRATIKNNRKRELQTEEEKANNSNEHKSDKDYIDAFTWFLTTALDSDEVSIHRTLIYLHDFVKPDSRTENYTRAYADKVVKEIFNEFVTADKSILDYEVGHYHQGNRTWVTFPEGYRGKVSTKDVNNSNKEVSNIANDILLGLSTLFSDPQSGYRGGSVLTNSTISLKSRLREKAKKENWPSDSPYTKALGVLITSLGDMKKFVFRDNADLFIKTFKDPDSKLTFDDSEISFQTKAEQQTRVQNEPSITLEQAIGLLKKILPDSIPLKSIEEIQKTLERDGVEAAGAFFRGVIYLANNTKSSTAYHEAFHAVFRILLTDSERANLMREAELKYGTPTEAEIEAFLKGRPAGFRTMSKQELKELVLEEKLADAFADHMEKNKNKSKIRYPNESWLRRLFRRLFNLIKAIGRRKNYIDKIFDRIASGDYRSRKIIRPESEAPAFKLITIEDEKGHSQSIGIELSKTVVNTVIYKVLSKQNSLVNSSQFSNSMIAEALSEILEDYTSDDFELALEDLSPQKQKEIDQKIRILTRIHRQTSVGIDNSLTDSVNEALKARGLQKVENEDIEFQDSEIDGLISDELQRFMKAVYEISPEETLTTRVKMFLQTIPYQRQDFSEVDIKFNRVIPFREVYKALQLATTNHPVFKIPSIIALKAKSNGAINAAYEEMVKVAKKDYLEKNPEASLEEADAKIRELFSRDSATAFKELTDISPLINSIAQGFYTSKATHITAAIDPDSGNISTFESNQQTDVNDQFIRWSKKYIGAKHTKEEQVEAIEALRLLYTNTKFLFKTSNAGVSSKTDIYVTRLYNKLGLTLPPKLIEQLSYNDKLNILVTLFDYVGIGISAPYLEYSIMKQLEEKGELESAIDDYGYLQEFKDALEMYKATDDSVDGVHLDLYDSENKNATKGLFLYLKESTKKSSLPNDSRFKDENSVYSGIYTKNPESGVAFDKGSLTGRIRNIARNNAVFDDTVGDSTIKNASGNNVQDKILPSFITEEVTGIRNFRNSYLYDVYYAILAPEHANDPERVYNIVKRIFENNGKVLPSRVIANAYIESLRNSPLIASAIAEYGEPVMTDLDVESVLDIIHENYRKSSLFIADSIVTRKILDDKRSTKDGKSQVIEFKSQGAESKYLTRLVHIADSAEKADSKDGRGDFRKVQIGVNSDKSTNIFVNRKYVETVEYADESGEVELKDNVVSTMFSMMRMEAMRMKQIADDIYERGNGTTIVAEVVSQEAIDLMEEIKADSQSKEGAVEEFLYQVLMENKLKVSSKTNRAFKPFYFDSGVSKLYLNILFGGVTDYNSEIARTFIEEAANDMFKDMIEDLIENNLMVYDRGEYKSNSLPTYYTTDEVVNMSNLADAFFFDFLVSAEFSSITYGDPGLLFRDFTNMVKRNGGLIAAGPNMGVGTTKVKIFKSENALIEDGDKVRHGVRDEGYDGKRGRIDRSDGQSYATMKFFREVYFKSKGLLSKDVDTTLKIIEHGLEAVFGSPNISALSAQGVLLSPKKLVYRDAFYYWKTSVSPLVRAEVSIMNPSIAARLKQIAQDVLQNPVATKEDALKAVLAEMKTMRENGEQIFQAKPGRKDLHDRLEELEREDVNLYVADSSMKMLKENVSEGFTSPITNESSIELSHYYLREQLNTDGVKKKIIHGTQLQGLVWSEQIRTAMHSFLGSKATPQAMSRLYRQIIAERGRYGYDAKMSELFTDETLSREKYDELLASLQRSLEASGSETDPFLIALFTSYTESSDGSVELVYDLNFSAVQAKYEAMFQSFLSSDVFKHKVPGTKFYNMSDLGYTITRNVYADSEISKEEYEQRVESKRATSLDEYILNNANNIEDLQYVDKDTKEPCK